MTLFGFVASLGLGVGVFIAARRGWLGYRFYGAGRAFSAAIVVGLIGVDVIAYTVDGVRSEGLITFLVVTGVVALVALSVWRSIQARSTILATCVAVAVLLAIGAPAIFHAATHMAFEIAGPLVVVGLLGYPLLKLVRSGSRY